MKMALEIDEIPRASSLLEVVASGVYRHGLSRVAALIDSSPSHLSEALSGHGRRKFSTSELERYIEKTGDLSPVIYLCRKFLKSAQVEEIESTAKLEAAKPHIDQIFLILARLQAALK